MPWMGKTEEDWNGLKFGFLKAVQANSFSKLIAAACTFKKKCSEDIFVCLGSLILSFTCNFFAYFKFHCDWGRVIGKIKQNELDCRDTVPLKDSALTAVKGMQNSNKGMWKGYHFSIEGIQKGYLFRKKQYIQGWRVGHRAKPPCINIFWVPLHPGGTLSNIDGHGYENVT